MYGDSIKDAPLESDSVSPLGVSSWTLFVMLTSTDVSSWQELRVLRSKVANVNYKNSQQYIPGY
jgi:hypothetical protein